MLIKTSCAAALFACALSMPASAAILAFTGQFSNDTPTPLPSASCLAGQVLVDFNPGNSTAHGTSNFGDFGPSQTHCITPGQPYAGTFSFAFDMGDLLAGTTGGWMTPTATPGVFNSFVTYTVTSGTGRFLGASGILHGVGLLDRRPTRPLNHLDITGSLNMPAVPEPASWTLMLSGFGFMGYALRRRESGKRRVHLRMARTA
jgi:hypothetical protein